jgi:hypothetical protein
MMFQTNPYTEKDIELARAAGRQWAEQVFALQPGPEWFYSTADAEKMIERLAFSPDVLASERLMRGMGFETNDAAQRRWNELLNPPPATEPDITIDEETDQ